MRHANWYVILYALAAVVAPAPQVIAESLTYNSNWGFQSPNALSVKLSRLDLEERKRGGFYESFKTENYYEGNIFNSYNCTGSSATNIANDSATTITATTSSPSTGSEVDTAADSLGNEQISTVLNAGPMNSDQETTGDVSSSVSLFLPNQTGVINSGGGSNKQDSDTQQTNSGNLSASSTSGVGCNFYPTATTSEAGVTR